MNLKIQSLTFLFLFALMGSLFTSCAEDELPGTPDPVDEPSASPTPTIDDGFGALWAINSISSTSTPLGNVDTELGTAVAFFSENNFSSFVAAGDVSIAGEDLEKMENNSYVHIPGVSNPLGLTFPDDYNWTVTGAGNVPSFTTPGLSTFPTVGQINSETTVSKSAGYTLSCAGIEDAREVLFLVGGVAKTVDGNTTQVEFSSSDLGGLEPGPNVVQVAAYTIEEREIEGKQIWVGIETVRTQSVDIQ